jgi:hypothetical protein
MTRDDILNMQAGYELNKLIAEFVFGMKLEKNHGFAGGYYWVGNGVLFGDVPAHGMPDYSTDISSAWEVVDKLVRFSITIESFPKGVLCRFFGAGQTTAGDAVGWADTAPLAICRAALLAVMK